MITSKITLMDPMGLHARIATKIVQCAQNFTCEITLFFNGQRSEVKDILGLMALDIREGETLEIDFNGSDETKAQAAMLNVLKEYQ